MFVANHLMTVDKVFGSKLAQANFPPEKLANLSELVPRIRRLGNEDFSEHISTKKQQLCDHLCEAEGERVDGGGGDAVSTAGGGAVNLRATGGLGY